MNKTPDWETVRQRLQRGAEHDSAALDLMMPRDADDEPARPVDPPPGVEPRAGAVLVLLYPRANEIYVPLTVRMGSLRHHSGEVSLPGGGFDQGDGTLERTALREAEEELGIRPAAVEIVAELTPIWIPVSNFRITPYVGLVDDRPAFTPAPDEVALVIEAPLKTLLDPAVVHSEIRDIRGRLLRVPYFAVEGQKVWGATALVLAQLVGRLQRG